MLDDGSSRGGELPSSGGASEGKKHQNTSGPVLPKKTSIEILRSVYCKYECNFSK